MLQLLLLLFSEQNDIPPGLRSDYIENTRAGLCREISQPHARTPVHERERNGIEANPHLYPRMSSFFLEVLLSFGLSFERVFDWTPRAWIFTQIRPWTPPSEHDG